MLHKSICKQIMKPSKQACLTGFAAVTKLDRAHEVSFLSFVLPVVLV